MTPKCKFADGEKVLCFHGPLIYEAKALKSSISKDNKLIKYLIHYAGWNKNWDEWVPENRVLKYNEANVQRQKEVFKQHGAPARNRKSTQKGRKSEGGMPPKDGDSRASTPSKEFTKDPKDAATPNSTPVAPSTSGRGSRAAKPTVTPAISTPNAPPSEIKDEATKKKRGRIDNPSVETEGQYISKVEIKVKIPDELKPYLVDDWDAVTRQNKLIDVPAKITVQDIVDNYVAFKKTSKTTNPTKELAINDVSNGLIEYFDVMLGSQLLYKFERAQYANIIEEHPDTPMSKLYGAFHLLRLFVKIGQMLAFTALDDKAVHTLMINLNEFLKFLIKNSSTYFSMTNFVNASPEYHRNAQ